LPEIRVGNSAQSIPISNDVHFMVFGGQFAPLIFPEKAVLNMKNTLDLTHQCDWSVSFE
jgi:hypothetical protein